MTKSKLREVSGVIAESAEFAAVKVLVNELEEKMPGFKFCIIGAKSDGTETGFDTVALVNAGYRKLYLQALWDIVNLDEEELEDMLAKRKVH